MKLYKKSILQIVDKKINCTRAKNSTLPDSVDTKLVEEILINTRKKIYNL